MSLMWKMEVCGVSRRATSQQQPNALTQVRASKCQVKASRDGTRAWCCLRNSADEGSHTLVCGTALRRVGPGCSKVTQTSHLEGSPSLDKPKGDEGRSLSFSSKGGLAHAFGVTAAQDCTEPHKSHKSSKCKPQIMAIARLVTPSENEKAL